MYSGLQVWIVCYQMVMAPHNPMQLQQSPVNIPDATSAIGVCRYISLETNYIVYLIWFIVGKLSIIHSTKISIEVLLCNFSLTQCTFYILSTSYYLKLNQAFRGNKKTTQSAVHMSHTVKLINLSTQNVKAKRNSHKCGPCNKFPTCHDRRIVGEIREVR